MDGGRVGKPGARWYSPGARMWDYQVDGKHNTDIETYLAWGCIVNLPLILWNL